MRVLVVDDDLNIGEIAETILAAEGHEVLVCQDGTDAMLHCVNREEPFDLILMDVVMPGMDGFTAIARLRDQAIETPIICVSAAPLPSAKRTATLLGADVFLAKPYRRSELLKTVDEAIRHRRAG